ncbi:protein KASH5, partial [Pezoporus wallicus]|uniref:protein KASH5 n=1 Tax=Pezoporus wallicus TaxID=35540 RepID=UPI0025514788
GSWFGEEPEAAAGDLAPAAEEEPTEPEPEHGAAPGAPPSPEPLQLLSRAQLLATHNRRLQREAEASEEQNSRLGEELQELRGQLRSTQQALERARAATEELEDTKAVVKGLEEQNLELRRRMRALEKEQSSLRSHADGLQEEAQLCRCSELLLSHEATAAQAGQRVAELTTALEEYETAVREQRLEAAQLQHQLNQLQETWGLQRWGSLGDTPMGQEGAEPRQDEAQVRTPPEAST